ncbi:MAG: DUF3536 domain-containing protein [Elusimicrobia bacterium]|nr:DUF3536 domain-containing protein [Elusimicrobiota bacterium]
MLNKNFVCIHGHFYQPPRENPITGLIDPEESASPYHNWNERICAECYKANTQSKIVKANGSMAQIVNNYENISFDFGPTLLAWLAKNEPQTYEAIIHADRVSRQEHSGHGNAIAQAYHHAILPLSSSQDKLTEIIWGIKDFEYRFSRKPEGFWLPETAVDQETLIFLSDSGVQFTILAPHQAKCFRKKASTAWTELKSNDIDPTKAYEVKLSRGRSIAVFFFNSVLAHDVAFNGLLNDGATYANRIIESFGSRSARVKIAHLATDGESYGHHHKFGDMALAGAIMHLKRMPGVKLANYGEFLQEHPPQDEVQIHENTSWSCAHGVERWKNGCGCKTGGEPDWNQAWRSPLRQALNLLRDYLALEFDHQGQRFFLDPWAARNDYVSILLDPSQENLKRFIRRWSIRPASDDLGSDMINFLEIERAALAMFTSCGWFFNDVSGIETKYILRYGVRAMSLAQKFFNVDVRDQFLHFLGQAKSNIPDAGDARLIFEKLLNDEWKNSVQDIRMESLPQENRALRYQN